MCKNFDHWEKVRRPNLSGYMDYGDIFSEIIAKTPIAHPLIK